MVGCRRVHLRQRSFLLYALGEGARDRREGGRTIRRQAGSRHEQGVPDFDSDPRWKESGRLHIAAALTLEEAGRYRADDDARRAGLSRTHRPLRLFSAPIPDSCCHRRVFQVL